MLCLLSSRFWSGNSKVLIFFGVHFGSPVGWRFSVSKQLYSDGCAPKSGGSGLGELRACAFEKNIFVPASFSVFEMSNSNDLSESELLCHPQIVCPSDIASFQVWCLSNSSIYHCSLVAYYQTTNIN